MRETADREVNTEEEAHLLDPRGNHPNGARSPQGYRFSEPDDDYGPSFLYDGLAAEAAAPRVPVTTVTSHPSLVTPTHVHSQSRPHPNTP